MRFSREMSLIQRYFAPLAGKEALGMGDDGAIFHPPAHREFVLASDSLVENIHFFATDPPRTIGQKLLRCNLSDMAAMGATPRGWLFNLVAPSSLSTTWLEEFCRGLKHDQDVYNLKLWGGDSTKTRGPLVLSATLIGDVKVGQALTRRGARDGDSLWVTGTIGDAALGLKARQGRLKDISGFLQQRYLLPQPRLGLPLHHWATSAMDISDGLVQDMSLLAHESRVGMRVELSRVPFSSAARPFVRTQLETILTGGDDYELLFTVPPHHEAALAATPFLPTMAGKVKISKIGRCCSEEDGVHVVRETGEPLTFTTKGWSHF